MSGESKKLISRKYPDEAPDQKATLQHILHGNILNGQIDNSISKLAFENNLICSYIPVTSHAWDPDEPVTSENIVYVWDLTEAKKIEYSYRAFYYFVYKNCVKDPLIQNLNDRSSEKFIKDRNLEDLSKYDLRVLYVMSKDNLKQMWRNIILLSSIEELNIETDDLWVIDQLINKSADLWLENADRIAYIQHKCSRSNNIYQKYLMNQLLRSTSKDEYRETLFTILQKYFSKISLNRYARESEALENKEFFIKFYIPTPASNLFLLKKYLFANDLKTIMFLNEHKLISTIGDVLREAVVTLNNFLKESKEQGYIFGKQLVKADVPKYLEYFKGYLAKYIEEKREPIYLFPFNRYNSFYGYNLERLSSYHNKPAFTPLHFARFHRNEDMFNYFLRYCDRKEFERTKYLVGFVPMIDINLKFTEEDDDIIVFFASSSSCSSEMIVKDKEDLFIFNDCIGVQDAGLRYHTGRFKKRYETEGRVENIERYRIRYTIRSIKG